mmetsp:Transcript_10291/g.15715  ORF Transcript_10291/g.15715 Transcript_10291/m.15715 type:complete len:802 (+) Transcript_10291:228-2633(+)
MVEHHLGESSSGGGGSESLGETEGLSDGEVSLHVDERGSGNGLLTNDDTSSLGESLVDGTNGIIRSLDLDEEDGLLEDGAGGELGSVHDSSSGGDDLTTTSVDSVGMEGNIVDVESDSSHVLIAHNTLVGGPLEGSLEGVLDFVQELDTLGDINEHVGAVSVGSEAPDLLGIGLVPLELLRKNLSSLLGVLLGADLFILDEVGELVGKRASLDVESVMLVGRLGQAHLGGLVSDSLLVRDDGVSLLDIALSVLLDEILKADFNVELTATGDDVLSGLGGLAHNKGIGLGQLLETVNELGEIGGVLDVDGNTHDGGHGVLHNSDVVSGIIGGDGTLLEEVLIDTNEGDGVTARNVGDGLDLTSHHDDGSLDVLDVEVVLGSGLVVGAHDSDLLSSSNGSGEDTAESVESTLIVGGDHLGDEDHEGTVLVALLDSSAGDIVLGSFVQVSGSVLLGLHGGRKLEDDHLKEGLSSVDPLLEHVLHEVLALELSLLALEVDLEGLEHLVDLLHLTVHGGSAESDDGLHDEGDEGSLEVGAIVGLVVVLPLLGLLIEVVVTPKLAHHLFSLDTELLGVDTGESGHGESPAEKGGSESDGSVNGVNLLGLAHALIFVGGDDNVDVLNNSEVVLIHGLAIDLELEDSSVDLVNHENGLDLLTESLSEHSLGLDGHTLDVVDDHKGTIGDSEGSSDLGGEINVTRGVNEVDEVTLLLALLDNIGLEVKGHTSGLDGDTTLLFVFTGIGSSGVSSSLTGNDTGLGDKGVSKGTLAVVDVSNNRHVSDLVSLVLTLSHLVNGEVWHVAQRIF